MSESPDREERLFRYAVRAYDAGDLDTAYTLFQQVVTLAGRRRAEAKAYLERIRERIDVTEECGMTLPPMEPLPPSPEQVADRKTMADAVANVITRAAGEIRTYGEVRQTLPDLQVKAGIQALPASGPQAALRRTPHMDLDPLPLVAKSARIKVSVYTNTGGLREGEDGDNVVVELPPGQDHVDLNVWLVVEEPFSVEGPDSRRLTLRRDQERSEPAVFTVARTGLGTAPTALFSALFAYKGRPCGRVSRSVAVSADTAEAPHVANPLVRLETGARPADLNVRIVASGTDGRTFQCNVQTSLIFAYQAGVTEGWGLKSLAGEVVGQQMDQFVKATENWSRTVALRAAGMKLFDASPRIFQKVLWELIDSGKLPETISIVTEEPYIPWELMVPNRRLESGKVEKRDPLGVAFLVSRWTSQQHVLPAQTMSLRDAYVIAPRDSKLEAAEDEAAMVMGQFHGERIDPSSPRMLDMKLAQHGPALLHFVCHGKSDEGGCQMLFLDQRQVLRADSLSGMGGVEKGLSTGKPLVFLNACEVGRQEPALVGTGGFAEEFMALGASAVIAPLWSVKDTIAHEIAVEFYRRIKAEPATPFAAILRDLRVRSYAVEGGEDTYAAYCFYGDPLATAG